MYQPVSSRRTPPWDVREPGLCSSPCRQSLAGLAGDKGFQPCLDQRSLLLNASYCPCALQQFIVDGKSGRISTTRKSPLKHQLIPRQSPRLIQCPRRQLQNRMSPQTDRDPPLRHIFPHLEDLLLPAQKHDIDHELHPERMHRFTRRDPKSLTAFKGCVLQKSRPAGTAVIRDRHPVPEHDASG
jgi:hypothetical protein